MNKLTISLENCYGITKMHTELDFANCNVYAIYAPNGAMKSSLAQTFKDMADGIPSKDRIFPERVCARNITDETGADLPRDSILVVSYRSDGMPSIDELLGMLREVKRHVRVCDGRRYQYALSTNRRNREVLLIGTD